MVYADWIGTQVSHYRLDRILAQGGMGVVFLARDMRLSRKVAVKFLSHERATPEALKRFRKEALTLSRLNHPGIATVHDYDEHDGVPFLVLEFVEAPSLAEQLKERGALPAAEVADIALQIAEALAYTHSCGIVHRDLKPANVVVSEDGRARILDFGVAQWAIADEEYARLYDITKITETVGTLPYMAPEQLIGVTEERSDIFSLGVMMFELATGKRPFHGSGPSAVMNSIRSDPPRPAAKIEERVPSWLAQTIQRCLEKAPEARYQSMEELRAALEKRDSGRRSRRGPRWAALAGALALLLAFGLWSALAGGGARLRSLAILPFRDNSGEPQLDSLADGITAGLINEFGRLSTLLVISRTSVQRYRDSSASLPEIAAQLHVDAVLEGSLQVDGGRVRVSAELRSAVDERRLWGGSFEAPVDQLLELERELVQAAAEGAGIELK